MQLVEEQCENAHRAGRGNDSDGVVGRFWIRLPTEAFGDDVPTPE